MLLLLNFEWVLYPFASDANLSLSLSGNGPSDSDVAIDFVSVETGIKVSF